MSIETAVTIAVLIGTYIILVIQCRSQMKENTELHRLLNETTREYKMYQALLQKDYPTAGHLQRGLRQAEPFAGVVKGEESDPPGSVVNQL